MSKPATIRLPNPINTPAEDHRGLITTVGGLVSGHLPIEVTDEYVYVYRVPTTWLIRTRPEVAKREYGYLSYNGAQIVADMAKAHGGGNKVVVAVDDPAQALDLVNEFQHLVHQRRRELAMGANANMGSGVYTKPAGKIGNLLDEYRVLLEQLKLEIYRQKELMRQVDYTSKP